MDGRYLSDKIAEWYHRNKRSLPWRDTTDAYKIWLSEIILQQTRVAQGLPYYQEFIKHYPNIEALASARLQDVLRLWQGLGYYTRARNLHRCAKAIMENHGGKFPNTFAELLTLPGIGHYTAAAIASFAFGEAVAVVDGNVFRVLSRLFGIDIPIDTPEARKRFTLLANEVISKKNPALHNQAMMEFGATFCTPVNPKCDDCPFKGPCFAYNHELVSALPVKKRKKKSRNRYFFYFVVEKNKRLLMRKRQEKDIWHGLFDFALIENSQRVNIHKLIATSPMGKWLNKTSPLTISKKYRHILTHQIIHCRFIQLKANRDFKAPDKDLTFYSAEQVAKLPKPALISRFLDERNAR